MARRTFIRMQLVGAKELEANLRKLPERLAKNTIDRGLLKVGQPIADDAAARAPRGDGKPVALHTKLAVSKTLSKRQRRQSRRKRPGERIVYIGVRPSPVAHLIEFGTGPRYTQAGAYRGMVKPNPFMRPAWDAGKYKALDDFGKILGREIEKSAERLHRRNMKRAA